jgi:hypothetical protein
MIPAILVIVVSAVVFTVLIFLGIWYFRFRHFKTTADKEKQQTMINDTLKPAGFAYDPKDDIFYSTMDCWQRELGYCKLFDEGAPLFNMVMDCEPVTFSYGGKRWLIELWKGQYGITTGAEIGIYNTSRDDIHTDKFTGTYYEPITDAERLPLSIVLRKNKKVVFRRKALHWWLTGFVLGEFSQPEELSMTAKIKFPNREMCNAFLEGLRKIGYTSKEYAVRFHTVTINYDKPHSPQPVSQSLAKRVVVQQINEANCKLFRYATKDYPTTMDKLEYIQRAVPELFDLFLHSLYAKGLFEAFRWLIDLILPKPTPPDPPEPCPKPCPEPCPEPCPKPCPEPCPEPCPKPCPEPCPKPCLKPCREVLSEPFSEPALEAVPELSSEPVPELLPEPASEASPEPERELLPKPAPETESNSMSRSYPGASQRPLYTCTKVSSTSFYQRQKSNYVYYYPRCEKTAGALQQPAITVPRKPVQKASKRTPPTTSAGG